MTDLVGADAAQHDESLEVVEFLVPRLGQFGLVRRAVVVEHAPVGDVVDEALPASRQR